jgi:hypothetical protein
MGEAKNKQKNKTPQQIVAETLSRKLADDGLLIEAGFHLFRAQVMSPDAPEVQVREMRMAWMAGCQHLFASMVGVMDAGDEITHNDMRRMDLIHKELEAFAEELKLRVYPSKGSA